METHGDWGEKQAQNNLDTVEIQCHYTPQSHVCSSVIDAGHEWLWIYVIQIVAVIVRRENMYLQTGFS